MNNLASYIDHTLLASNATEEQIDKLCAEAVKHSFCSVCVNSGYVAYAYDKVKDSAVKVCSVVGFPLGSMDIAAKAYEAKLAITNGATEIDMVVNVGWLKSGRWDLVELDIEALREICEGVVLKVIFETALLEDSDIEKLCEICTKFKVDFVKTSTGFSTRGASLEDVILMKSSIGNGVSIKASGGIRDRAKAIEMIDAGATRLGTSSGVAIVAGLESATEGY